MLLLIYHHFVVQNSMERAHIKPPPDVCLAKTKHLCGDAITPTPNYQIHSQRHANLSVQASTDLFLELLPYSPDLTSRRTFKGKAHPLCVSLFPFKRNNTERLRVLLRI